MDLDEIGSTLAVQRVMSKYANAWDHADLDLLEEVLAPDCSIDYTVFGALDGREAVLEFAEEYFAGETQFDDWFHVYSNPWIEVDPGADRASGRWHFLGVYTFESIGATWQTGFYDVTFERPDDQWLIADLVLEYKYISPYDRGWDEVPMAPEVVE